MYHNSVGRRESEEYKIAASRGTVEATQSVSTGLELERNGGFVFGIYAVESGWNLRQQEAD